MELEERHTSVGIESHVTQSLRFSRKASGDPGIQVASHRGFLCKLLVVTSGSCRCPYQTQYPRSICTCSCRTLSVCHHDTAGGIYSSPFPSQSPQYPATNLIRLSLCPSHYKQCCSRKCCRLTTPADTSGKKHRLVLEAFQRLPSSWVSLILRIFRNHLNSDAPHPYILTLDR